MDPKPPPIEGAPYLARSLREMWETADLSTALLSGRNDKLGVIANVGFFKPFSFLWVGRRPMNAPVEMTKLWRPEMIFDRREAERNDLSHRFERRCRAIQRSGHFVHLLLRASWIVCIHGFSHPWDDHRGIAGEFSRRIDGVLVPRPAR